MDKLVHLEAQLPLGMLEDVLDAELNSRTIRLSLRLSDEDGTEQLGACWGELTDGWGEVGTATYGETKFAHTVGEVAM